MFVCCVLLNEDDSALWIGVRWLTSMVGEVSEPESHQYLPNERYLLAQHWFVGKFPRHWWSKSMEKILWHFLPSFLVSSVSVCNRTKRDSICCVSPTPVDDSRRSNVDGIKLVARLRKRVHCSCGIWSKRTFVESLRRADKAFKVGRRVVSGDESVDDDEWFESALDNVRINIDFQRMNEEKDEWVVLNILFFFFLFFSV